MLVILVPGLGQGGDTRVEQFPQGAAELGEIRIFAGAIALDQNADPLPLGRHYFRPAAAALVVGSAPDHVASAVGP